MGASRHAAPTGRSALMLMSIVSDTRLARGQTWPPDERGARRRVSQLGTRIDSAYGRKTPHRESADTGTLADIFPEEKEALCSIAKVRIKRAPPAGHPRVREGFAFSMRIQIAPRRLASSEGGKIAE